MNGFVNINKPAGITSFDVIRELRRSLQIKKMGHLGTLDPEATGVLPVAIGSATRVISFLEDQSKSYRSRGRLGAVSTTQDKTGELTIIDPAPEVSRDQLVRALTNLTGTIMQKPPMFSAVHHNGRRLYELAREGVEVEVATRPITIYRLEMLAMGKDDQGIWVDLDIECSRGTYIRTIWHDLGQALGCGAYMELLQRTRAGAFTIENSVPLDQVNRQSILPMDMPFSHWQEILVAGLIEQRISNGNSVGIPCTDLKPGEVLIKDIVGNFLAVGEITTSGLIKPWRVIAQTDKG